MPKFTLFTITLLLFINACASTSITTNTVEEPDFAHEKVLVLYTTSDHSIHQLDSLTYNRSIKNSFNTLDDVRYRSQLEDTFMRSLRPNTVAISGRDLFDINRQISFDEFMETVSSYDPDAILLVDRKSYTTRQVISGTDGNVSSRQEPSGTFNCYLFAFDGNNPMEIQWMANVHVRGTFAGYDTINNHLSRNVVRRLKRAGFIR